MSDKTATDWVIYDPVTGDLLEGPMSYERAYRKVERDGEYDGEPGHLPIAMARQGEMRRIQKAISRQMSGNPPRDRRNRN
jgi:hypothetical protein